MSLIKRLFVFSLVITTVLSLNGVNLNSVKAAGNYGAGSLLALQGQTGAAVYYIGSDGKKYVFPDSKTYSTWYANFNDVVRVSVTELDMYQDGGAVTYRAGTKLITHSNTSKIYAIGDGGMIHWVPSEAIAVALYGASWYKNVMDVIPGYFSSSYTLGADLSDKYPSGTLLQMGENMYVVDGTSVRPFADADAFEANNFVYANLIEVASISGYTTGESVTGEEAGLSGFMPAEGGSVTPPPAVGGGLSISLASDSPAANVGTLMGSDATLFSKFRFTATQGDVVVTGLKVKRTGLGNADDFAKVFVVVDGVRRGSQKSMSSTDESSLLFSSDSQKVTIANGQTKVFELYAQMADASTSGAYNGLGIIEVTTNGGSVSGLPVYGATLGGVSAAAPTATVTQVAVGTTLNIGDTNAEVAKLQVQNGNANEAILVNAMVLKSASVSGTRAQYDDLVNFKLYDEDMVLLAGPVNMSADSYVRFNLSSPFEIPAGTSKKEKFTVTADVAKGPGNQIKLDIEYAGDLTMYGSQNGNHTNADITGFTATEITIGNAELSVSLATDSPLTRTMVDDTTGIVLAKGHLRADQGPVTISGSAIILTGNDLDIAEYAYLRLYVDDVLISEEAAPITANNATSKTVSFTDEFSVDGVVPFEIQIDAENAIDANDWIRASLSGSGMTVTRDSDNASIAGSGTATGNKVTFGAAAVTVTPSASAPALTRVKGAEGVVFAAFDVQVGTASDVTLNSIKLNYGATGGTADQNDLQNLYLLNSDMTKWVGPANLNSSEQYNFTGLSKDLTGGSTMRFYVMADLNSTFNDSNITAVNLEIIEVLATDANGDSINVTDDGSTVISTTNEVNDDGATTTITVVGSGTLTAELSSATPKSGAVIASSNGILTTEVKLRAEYEAVNITKMLLTTAAGSANDDELAKVYLYADGVLVGQTTSIISGVATFNFATGDFVVPAGKTVVLTVRADFNTSDNSLADTGATVRFTINDFNADVEAQGTSNDIYLNVYSTTGSGVTLTSNATAALNDVTDINTTDTAITYDTLAVGTIDVGNLIAIGTEYMLVTANTGTVLTVVRAVGGTTAAAHLDDAVITEYDQKLAGETMLIYANHPIVSLPTQPTGELKVGTWDAFKFTVTPAANAEEDLRLEELVVRVDGAGMAATTGWVISAARLYKGTQLVGTASAGLNASGDLTFAGLDSDVDGLVTTATTFTVQLDVALGSTPGTIDSGDTLQVSINNFGSVNAAGAITAGDFDWIDMEAPTTVIEWVGINETILQGYTFVKS